MNILKIIDKPEYFFQPFKVLSRIKYFFIRNSREPRIMNLTWGGKIRANPFQTIGRSLFTFGLYDLSLSELIKKIVKPGDTVIDIGANIGYTSLIMQKALNNTGSLMSFEPLPDLFNKLKNNLALNSYSSSNLKIFNCALSDTTGEAEITIPADFDGNDGIATLENSASGKKLKIATKTIDSLDLKEKIKLIKIDVEGHEPAVLRGAGELLKSGLVENIIFEDLAGYPGQTSTILEKNGYRIYKLVKEFSGLSLKDANYQSKYSFEPDNFLACKSVELVNQINQKKEWSLFSWK